MRSNTPATSILLVGLAYVASGCGADRTIMEPVSVSVSLVPARSTTGIPVKQILEDDATTSSISNGGRVVGNLWPNSGPFTWTARSGPSMLPLAFGVAEMGNTRGQVAGSGSASSGGPSHAFLWTEQTGLVDLTPDAVFGHGLALNDRGQVVGAVRHSFGSGLNGFVWSEQDGLVDLGTFGGDAALAMDINNRSEIVALVALPDGTQATFVGTRKRGFRQIGHFPDGSTRTRGRRINSRGQVVGTGWSSPLIRTAFIWDDGVFTDLGTLGGATSFAFGVNDCGHVVGSSDTTEGERHAFLWRDGEMLDLGTLGGDQSFAEGINNRGQAVGGAMSSDGAFKAVIWNVGGGC